MRNDVIKRLAAANPVPRSQGFTPAPINGGLRLRMVAVAVSMATIAAVVGAVSLSLSGSHTGPPGAVAPRVDGPPGPTGRQGPIGPTGAGPTGGPGLGPTAPTGPTPSTGPTGSFGPTGDFYGLTGWTPAGSGPGVPISLSDASAALDARVVLPNAPPLTPSDTASAKAIARCPHRGATPASRCDVTVEFPSVGRTGLTVTYSPNTYPDPLTIYQDNPYANRFEVDHIGGVAALAIPADPANPIYNYSFVQFAVGGTTVALVGDFDLATLERLGKSIIDRY